MKLTKELLTKIIKEEMAKFGEPESTEDRAKDTEETDADELADAQEKHVDFQKALKIEEARLVKRLKRIREQRARLSKKSK